MARDDFVYAEYVRDPQGLIIDTRWYYVPITSSTVPPGTFIGWYHRATDTLERSIPAADPPNRRIWSKADYQQMLQQHLSNPE